MIRFEHTTEPLIVYYNFTKIFRLCEFSIETIVRVPESYLNGEIVFNKLAFLNDTCYFDPEEVQMYADISGLNTTSKHLPIISYNSIFKQSPRIHLFPVDAKTSEEKVKELLQKLDMFKCIAND